MSFSPFGHGHGDLVFVDGSHIKGLLMNFLHVLWPELLKRDGFIIGEGSGIIILEGRRILKVAVRTGRNGLERS